MISTTWTDAPADFLGLGISDARPYVFEGSAVSCGRHGDVMTGATRLRTADRSVASQSEGQHVRLGLPVEVPAVAVRGVQKFVVRKFIAPATGTTRGIPSSSRPPS